jgi:hypothetical protein
MPDKVIKGGCSSRLLRYNFRQFEFILFASSCTFDMSKSKSLDQSLGVAPLPVEAGEVDDGVSKDIQHDAVFGDITEDGPNYRNVRPSTSKLLSFANIFSKVGWLGTAVLMIKTQIALGVLSIPSVFHTLGLIPGVLILVTIGGITT